MASDPGARDKFLKAERLRVRRADDFPYINVEFTAIKRHFIDESYIDITIGIL